MEESHASIVAACVHRNCRQVKRLRCDAGGIRSRLSTRRTVDAPTRTPGRAARPGSAYIPSPVASTLAAAALFNPLRRRVQQGVDRRFNRARYDADKTVAAFAGRLKDAVALDAVRDDLAGVVHQALEPAHVSVWISHRD
jgi:hypothetical protein